VTGWGKNAFGNNGMYQSILKEVDVPVLSQADCQTALRKTRLGNFFVLDTSFMCAGGEAGKDACTVREYDILLLIKHECILHSNPDSKVIFINNMYSLVNSSNIIMNFL